MQMLMLSLLQLYQTSLSHCCNLELIFYYFFLRIFMFRKDHYLNRSLSDASSTIYLSFNNITAVVNSNKSMNIWLTQNFR